jgi:hypothetical protein
MKRRRAGLLSCPPVRRVSSPLQRRKEAFRAPGARLWRVPSGPAIEEFAFRHGFLVGRLMKTGESGR